jgi:hypothetical protein
MFDILILFTLVFHFLFNPDPYPVPEPESGSAKAECCGSGSTTLLCYLPIFLGFLLYSGAGHSAVGEARLLCHGGHGDARLPPLGLSQAAIRGHAHHYRLHQVHHTEKPGKEIRQWH